MHWLETAFCLLAYLLSVCCCKHFCSSLGQDETIELSINTELALKWFNLMYY